ncbi:MAG: restriction endonuclease subunit S, partial [Rickettsiales bacterium]
MLPEGWEKKPIGEYLKILSGFPFQSEFFASVETGGVPIIRIRDLLDGESETHYSGEYDATYLVAKNDILVGMDGEFHIVRWQGIESLLNQRICKVSSNDNTVLDTHFIYYFLQPHLLQMQHDIAATTVKHLSTKHLKSIVAPIPHLTEQKRIAEVLGSVDSAIEATKAVITQTKKLKQGLLQTLLTKGIGHTKFKDSPLGEIPESWKVKTLKDLCDIKHGFAFSGDCFTNEPSEYLLLTPVNFCIDGGFNTEKLRFYTGEILDDYVLDGGELIVSMTDLSKNGDTLGNGAILPINYPHHFLHNQRIGLVENINKKILNRKFLYLT